MDFTLKIYKKFLTTLQATGYTIYTFEDYLKIDKLAEKFVILRHDVDEYPEIALQMAEVEHTLGIKSTYYFRIIKRSNNPEIIKKIVTLGHEVGYHYEDVSFAKGDIELSKKTFLINLEYFRSFYPVKTVCMHGSSASKHDNRCIWEYVKLENYGLIGEPYITTDFNKVFYISDTGRAWDREKYRTRDIIVNQVHLNLHSTKHIIKSIINNEFPNQIMLLAHTLWTNNFFLWLWILIRSVLLNKFKYLAMNNHYIMKLYSTLSKYINK